MLIMRLCIVQDYVIFTVIKSRYTIHLHAKTMSSRSELIWVFVIVQLQQCVAV